MTKVLLVEDNETIRDMLSRWLVNGATKPLWPTSARSAPQLVG
jgi:CheY-like chemotaxis protein